MGGGGRSCWEETEAKRGGGGQKLPQSGMLDVSQNRDVHATLSVLWSCLNGRRAAVSTIKPPACGVGRAMGTGSHDCTRLGLNPRALLLHNPLASGRTPRPCVALTPQRTIIYHSIIALPHSFVAATPVLPQPPQNDVGMALLQQLGSHSDAQAMNQQQQQKQQGAQPPTANPTTITIKACDSLDEVACGGIDGGRSSGPHGRGGARGFAAAALGGGCGDEDGGYCLNPWASLESSILAVIQADSADTVGGAPGAGWMRGVSQLWGGGRRGTDG